MSTSRRIFSALPFALTIAVVTTALAGCAGGLQSSVSSAPSCGGPALGASCVGIQSSMGSGSQTGVQMYGTADINYGSSKTTVR